MAEQCGSEFPDKMGGTMTATGSGAVPLDRPNGSRLLGWGLAVWAAVAVFVRLAGHVLLDPGRPLVVVGFFIAVIPLMALVTYPVYRWVGIGAAGRPAAAALMSLPGLFLDVLLVVGAGRAFPAMTAGAVINFGAILLFGYGVVLLTGFVPATGPRAPFDA